MFAGRLNTERKFPRDVLPCCDQLPPFDRYINIT